MIQILPNQSADFNFTLYPLQIGFCKIPEFHSKINKSNHLSEKNEDLENNEFSIQMDQKLQNMLPTQIFIFPK